MQKKVSLCFDSAWVLSKKDDEKLPVALFADTVKSVLDAKILYATPTDCEFVIQAEDATDSLIRSRVLDLIGRLFETDDLSCVKFCEVSDYKLKITVPPSVREDEEPAEDNELQIALEKIRALVGAEEFKALAEEYVKIAPGLLKYRTVETLTHQAYLFAINDGDGLSTYLQLFAELLSGLGLFTFNGKSPIAEIKIPLPGPRDVGDPFGSVYGCLRKGVGKGGKIISVDISEWMTKIGDKAFREFLSKLDDQMGENIIVFRVPFLEKKILEGLRRGIADVLFVRELSFVPFDREELTLFAENFLDQLGFTLREDALEVFHARIIEEKIDGRFYGINTVKKVIREMIYKKQLDNALNGVDDTVVKKDEILSLSALYTDHQKTAEQLLDEMIGVEPIRARIDEIVCQIEAGLKFPELGSPCIHMRFVGNPGTGKTTVARVIGKILKEKGILRNGHFFEYAGRDFCGQFVGETAPKTAAMCRDAYGSVLFIDEAYTLYRENRPGTVDYGREAIDTLIAEMENHRSDLVIIMAGYPDEMATLMKANAGLESRMPYVIEFPNYTREQLCDIFMLMVNKTFTYSEGFDTAVKEYFDSLPEELISSKEFSNARFVRNLFERTWGKAMLRAQLNKEDPSVLVKQDFLLASSEKEFGKIMKKPSRSLGFI